MIYRNLEYLASFDPEMAEAVEKELSRQQNGIELIASENFVSEAVMAANSSVSNTVRTIYSVNIERCENNIDVKICGDGFLYNMVRIIVGTLVAVAEGKITSEDIPSIIESKDRSRAGVTAPPQGLYLNRVTY